MIPEVLFRIILAFVLIGFFLDRLLSWLNSRSWAEEIPESMKDYYEKEKYLEARAYDRANSNLSMVSSVYGLVLILFMLFFDGFAFVDEVVRSVTENTYFMPVLFFGILLLASDILNLPFSLYSTFVIEEKFGFNKMGPTLYFMDKLKTYVLAVVIGLPLLVVFIWLYDHFGKDFWIPLWVVISGISIFMAMFYTSIIVPVFNKLDPLEDCELRQSIEEYCQGVGFELSNIYVMDGSKRSSKTNAYFSGLGARKNIVLFDTLIEKHDTDEIVSILAHEVGHYKMKHVRTSVMISALQSGFMLFLLSTMINSEVLGLALGVKKMSLHIGLIAFSLLYSPVSTIFGIGMNVLSRRNEYQADAFAARTFAPESMIRALKKLSVDNLSNLFPHPAYVFVNYSHPPVLKRISAIEKLNAISES